jgi:AcrR family transcriptional regulator
MFLHHLIVKVGKTCYQSTIGPMCPVMDKSAKMSEKAEVPMKEEQEDRRTKRTDESLIHALIELIEVKPYDLITVQDITEKANVGRSTFYAHNQNKDSLLLKGFERLLDLLTGGIGLSGDGMMIFDTTILFGHARGHREIYKKLLWGSGFKLLMKDAHFTLSKKIEDRLASLLPARQSCTIPLPLLSYIMSGALLMMLRWWLDKGMPHSPEEMDSFFQQLIMESTKKAIS